MTRHWNNKGRIIFGSLLLALFALCFLLYASSSKARVTGVCSNCHTMHNSQGGAHMQTGYASTEGAKERLLRANGCLGCHATTGDGSTGVGGAPIVYNTGGVGYGDSHLDNKKIGLAAGNFYWTTTASGATSTTSRGHSISGISNDDITIPSDQRISCGDGCHQEGLKTQGCKGCHLPAHHKGASSGGWADANDGYYRFLGPVLSGGFPVSDHKSVRGYEDPDWQKNASTTVHNEYSGEAANGYHSITAHCMGCHDGGSYPDECPEFLVFFDPPPLPIITRYHQATLVLSAADPAKWSGYRWHACAIPPCPYGPMLPIARVNITSYISPSETVYTTDALMCLTCHRAHASPYDKMLRWDNSLAWADLPNESCKGCHSTDPIP